MVSYEKINDLFYQTLMLLKIIKTCQLNKYMQIRIANPC